MYSHPVKLGKLYPRARKSFKSQWKLDYDGVQYETIRFATWRAQWWAKVVRLASRLGQSVDLYLPDAGVDYCGLYSERQLLYDSFDCGTAQRSIGNDTTLIKRQQMIESLRLSLNTKMNCRNTWRPRFDDSK